MKWRIMGTILMGIAIVCLIGIGFILMSDGGDVQQYKYAGTETGEQDETDGVKNPINWAKLQKENKNIYAWINVPGTKIDYPVLQASKDQEEDFYLKHNIKDQYAFAGSIYSQKKNSKDFQDPVTVLYGHSMINGSMFGTLKNFVDKDFFKSHSFFYIYIPGKIYTYKIVSYYVGDKQHLLDTFHPENKTGFKNYIRAIENHGGNKRNDVTLDEKDRIVTLSTCSPMESGRRLLHGVLVKTTETK